jgi:phosphatidylserine/phosphatidylglycerophosphate/cardiolipin synthase-like enzyme
VRNREKVGDLSVQAIAGTHVVLLGIDFAQTKCPGLLGFSIRRHDHTEGESYWLSGYKTFESTEPHPAPGLLYSTHEHPIQGFTWSDFSAKPDHDYAYEIVALRGTPSNRQDAETASVSIKTEKEDGTTHHVHFNRGAAASQEYTRRFGDKSPNKVGPAAFEWLSRGAAEALANFIARAKNSGWGLRVGAYEFTDPTVLKALKAAADRGADVQILYHARNDEQEIRNQEAIQEFGLENISKERNAQGLTLSHNKTIVLTKAGVAVALLTGSTNFSVGGIYGHSNVVHICESDKVAAEYLWLWEELAKNAPKSTSSAILETRTPLPAHPLQRQVTPVFSPRPNLKALEWYAEQARKADDALFMTFAFGMNSLFQDAYRTGTAKLRYALMEAMSGPTRTKQQKEANEALIITLRRMVQNKFAIGSRLGTGAFNHWLVEKLSGLNVNVRYLHTKYMLVDPLGPNPLVVGGSANFSDASTTNNDENMLVIRGNARVADIYLGEFMRLYRHFAFRDWLTQHPEADEVEVGHLDERDQWWKGYFGDSFASRQREYFAGKDS